MSFSREDGDLLLGGLNELDVSDDVRSLLMQDSGRINSRLFRSSLIEMGMAFDFPTTVNMELNRRCVLDCKHCYIGSTELHDHTSRGVLEQMEINEVRKTFQDLKDLGVFMLVFTGGEPLINTRIQELVLLAAEMDFAVEIFSNLQVIPEWLYIGSAQRLHISRIQTSVYSSDPDIHDLITRVPGSHGRTMRNLQILMGSGYYVEVATPLMYLNIDGWRETEKFITDLGIHHDFSWPIVNEYYESPTGKSALNPATQQWQAFVRENPDFL